MPIFNRINNRKTEIIVLMVLVYELCFPHYALAAELNKQDETSNEVEKSIILPKFTISTSTNEILSEPESADQAVIIEAPTYKVVKSYVVPITAYNSEPGQTDDSPCRTANGFNLCQNNEENVIAANFLKFGTKVRIPEYFGDRIFTVQDRMNARYYYRADVWFKTKLDARKFGIRVLKIEVVEEIN